MTTIRAVIQKIIAKMTVMNGYKEAWVKKYWLDLVGEDAVKHSIPYKVERNILFVRVDSSVWNQEMFMKRGSLIKKINQSFSQKIIDDVKYQMGYFTKKEEASGISINDLLSKEDEAALSRTTLWDRNVLKSLQRKRK
jgi:predicted nucleic acid-binding Zn ribbon protein